GWRVWTKKESIMSQAYQNLSREDRNRVDRLLADTKAHGGVAPVDLDAFWRDQETALADPFGASIPQVPLGAICNWECIFDELGLDMDGWRFLYEDRAWALEISRQYNDRAEAIVGRRILKEQPDEPPERCWPEVKELHDLFEARNVWEGGPGGSWWLQPAADTPAELSALLDRVEKRLEHLRDFLLPENWGEAQKRLTALGVPPRLYRRQRGPCTFACSIFGPENLLLLAYDDPDLFARFSDVLGRAILERARVLDEEAGFDAAAAVRGWSWADDNCCLFTPAMYEVFAMPIHRMVFSRYAPDAGDQRYQHSDSAMGHLLPLLTELRLTRTNFGPTLTVAEIRRHCPQAVIDGQLAPFTYSRNEQAEIVAEFLRDFGQARAARGLKFSTAGSINNGTRLTSMRLLMAAIQRYGRYAP
ncbi:MAG: uroporphyrinogen decarboxylase family protein, partial [Kiritimatiellia bacterium]|nr:uroporphyrinogen decarboxylase family protein [Kiritimatiellia bacterium]